MLEENERIRFEAALSSVNFVSALPISLWQI